MTEKLGKTIIRSDRLKTWVVFLSPLLITAYYIIGPYDSTRIIYKSDPGLFWSMVIFLGAMFLYGLYDLPTNKGEIILNDDGIEIQGQGGCHWDFVVSIGLTIEEDKENGNEVTLVVQLRDLQELTCNVTNFPMPGGNILALVRKYKNNYSPSEGTGDN